MSIGSFVKSVQNIMRGDSGVNGDAQRIEQMVWMLFLKIYDAKEEEWESTNDHYQSIIPEELRWRNWAIDKQDGQALTSENLLNFVNNELFVKLKNLPINANTSPRHAIVPTMFADANNYMKDGILLRQVINEVNKIDFEAYDDRHAFGEIYETILKSLQSAGNAGEFYTPRAVTDFIVKMIDPKMGEQVADFACGTGGFLTSTLKHLQAQAVTTTDQHALRKSVYGIEKKPLPYMLAVTNLLLHDIDNPQIINGNGLTQDVRNLSDEERFDVVIMNPPYGGTEGQTIKNNFPTELQSSETADLFMSVAMYRLKTPTQGGGRCAMVIPDGFLFGTDGAKSAIKQRLIEEFNLHTIIRLPASVFAPYTSITTNILFFDNTKTTEQVWFYRVDMPTDQKHFSKTKPMKLEHFAEAMAWWDNRVTIKDTDTDTYKAKAYTPDELKTVVTEEKLVTKKDGSTETITETKTTYDLDLCGYPTVEEEVLSPEDTIRTFHQQRDELNRRIDEQLTQIANLIGLDLVKADLIDEVVTEDKAGEA